jgi:hypothetical protein
MGTKVWGPPMWRTLHFIALGYPTNPTNDHKQAYKHFFENLHHVIPCGLCASNYQQHLQEVDISTFLENTDTLFAWTVHVHNIVNKENGKREWSVEEAKTHYIEALKNGSTETTTVSSDTTHSHAQSYTQAIMTFIIIALSCAVVFLWLKKRYKAA